MNIVHVVRQFYPAIGGIETVVQELVAAQVAAGHRVRVITLNRVFKSNKVSVLPAREVIGGAEIIRIPFVGSTRYPIAPSAIRFIEDADIVHVHAIDFLFDYLAWSKLYHRKRLVVSTHGGFFHTSYAARIKRIYFSTITRMSLALYDGVAAVSLADQELFSSIRKRDVVCIENGVSISKYSNAASSAPVKRILTLGRLARSKRLDRLIRFMAAVRQHDPEWKLTIAGRLWDINESDLTALAEAQRIHDAVEIVISPSEKEIRQLMGRCSVIASASEYEGFGLVAVEGMSAGLFPLLSDIPTFRLLITRAAIGMVVDFADPEAAADKLIGIWPTIEADYPNFQNSVVAAASKYDWSYVSREYARLYDHVCGTNTRRILGVPILVSTTAEAVELLDSRFTEGISTVVAFANAHLLNIASEDEHYRTVLQDFIIFNDGIGVDIASRVLFGSPFPQNLNGTDFTPEYLRKTQHCYRIFLLGSRQDIVERASQYLSKISSRHQIVGWHHGYYSKEDTAKIVKMISESNADIVLVGMGNPQQELWLADNLEATGCRLAFGVGALFDFTAGRARRAPAWIRAVRLEWLYRLIREPERLWRRYLIGNPLFVIRVLGQRFFGLPMNTIDITLP